MDYQVDCLCGGESIDTTPGLAPQPFLWQGVDGNLMLRIIWKILIKVGERVLVSAESLVRAS